jgi:TetR/AcrR family transcriptional regulator
MVKRGGRGVRQPDRGTEQRILDAANAVFVRRGTAGARMQEIADEAGVNKALLHYYFRDKSHLAEAVFRRVAGGLLPVMEMLASDTPLEEKVRRFIGFELEYLSRNPFAPAYVISELGQHPERGLELLKTLTSFEIDPRHDAVIETLDRQLKARARDGTMRRIPVEQFLANLVSLCVFPFAARPLLAARLGLDDRGFQRFIGQRKKQLPEFFLNALRP